MRHFQTTLDCMEPWLCLDQIKVLRRVCRLARSSLDHAFWRSIRITRDCLAGPGFEQLTVNGSHSLNAETVKHIRRFTVKTKHPDAIRGVGPDARRFLGVLEEVQERVMYVLENAQTLEYFHIDDMSELPHVIQVLTAHGAPNMKMFGRYMYDDWDSFWTGLKSAVLKGQPENLLPDKLAVLFPKLHTLNVHITRRLSAKQHVTIPKVQRLNVYMLRDAAEDPEELYYLISNTPTAQEVHVHFGHYPLFSWKIPTPPPLVNVTKFGAVVNKYCSNAEELLEPLLRWFPNLEDFVWGSTKALNNKSVSLLASLCPRLKRVALHSLAMITLLSPLRQLKDLLIDLTFNEAGEKIFDLGKVLIDMPEWWRDNLRTITVTQNFNNLEKDVNERRMMLKKFSQLVCSQCARGCRNLVWCKVEGRECGIDIYVFVVDGEAAHTEQWSREYVNAHKMYQVRRPNIEDVAYL